MLESWTSRIFTFSNKDTSNELGAGKLTFEELDFNPHAILEGTLESVAERSQAKKIRACRLH